MIDPIELSNSIGDSLEPTTLEIGIRSCLSVLSVRAMDEESLRVRSSLPTSINCTIWDVSPMKFMAQLKT